LYNMGGIDPNTDIRKQALLLLGLSQGINVLSRVYKEHELFENMIHAALQGSNCCLKFMYIRSWAE
jgi:hypothetical protein